MTTDIDTGPATWDQLHELHGLLTRELIARLQGQPSAELLAVARGLLRHNGVRAETPEQDLELRDLYKLLARRLYEAITGPSPSASIMAEARHFISSQGITKDLGAAIDQATALRALDLSNLPFKT